MEQKTGRVYTLIGECDLNDTRYISPRNQQGFGLTGQWVDEFHHAAARTYQQLLIHFEPRFLLGLTATPERTDQSDILALCDDNLVYIKDLFDGIESQLLCPFTYYGIADEVDYREICHLRQAPGLPEDYDLVAISSFSAKIPETYELARQFMARRVLVCWWPSVS